MSNKDRPQRGVQVLVWFVEALLLSLVLLYLGEEFGWHWVREAGGRSSSG